MKSPEFSLKSHEFHFDQESKLTSKYLASGLETKVAQEDSYHQIPWQIMNS